MKRVFSVARGDKIIKQILKDAGSDKSGQVNKAILKLFLDIL